MNLFEYEQLFSKIFEAKNYLYSMTVYHLLALLFFLTGITGFNLQTLVGIDQSLVDHSKSVLSVIESYHNLSPILIIVSILLIVDLIFLFIVAFDFPGLKLNYSKIMKIEGLIFIVALFVPIFRAMMLFFSLNTLQIFFFYHVAAFFTKYNIPNLPKYIIVSIGYFWLLKIVVYPVGIVL